MKTNFIQVFLVFLFCVFAQQLGATPYAAPPAQKKQNDISIKTIEVATGKKLSLKEKIALWILKRKANKYYKANRNIKISTIDGSSIKGTLTRFSRDTIYLTNYPPKRAFKNHQRTIHNEIAIPVSEIRKIKMRKGGFLWVHTIIFTLVLYGLSWILALNSGRPDLAFLIAHFLFVVYGLSIIAIFTLLSQLINSTKRMYINGDPANLNMELLSQLL